MCGIVAAVSTLSVESFVVAAHKRQRHRGPDSEGLYFDRVGDAFIGMAHQRLSILDLSENGAQPMLSASGKYRIIYNGEVYNYKSLIKEFGLTNLNSMSDTEVVLELIEKLGVRDACRHFNGMWALAVHDIEAKKIYISRDRLGKKPFYYWQNDTGVFIASELHSLLRHPGLSKTYKPDPVVAARFLAYGIQNVDNRSWIEGVSFLPPACMGEISLEQPEQGVVNISSYWQPENSQIDSNTSSDSLIDELKALIGDAVKIRLQADVPVGIALSGGLDSSIITALATSDPDSGTGSVNLFSSVNPESTDDESYFVDCMAEHVNRDVNKFVLSPAGGDDLLETLNACISHSDGPMTSFASLLFYKLMDSATEVGVKVILTGQGADEAFCGYRKYPILEAKRRLRSGDLIGAFSFISKFALNGTLFSEFNFKEAKRYLGVSSKSILGSVSLKALDGLSLSTIDELSDRQWDDVSKLSVPYLCHYEDRMSMAFSREVRSPFLDYRVIEFGLRSPTHLKMRDGWTKYGLRKAFESDLPEEITWRKDKKGFVNPQDEWFKSILSDYVWEILSDPNAKVYTFGLVDREAYLRMFTNYMQDKGSIWFRDVFAPFSLELWLSYLESATEPQ